MAGWPHWHDLWPTRADRSRVVLIDVPPTPAEPVRPVLRRIAAEAVIRQDEAERVLVRVRRREPFGEIVQQAGPLIRRFFALRESLPKACDDPTDEQLRATLEVVLYHDAMVLATAQELLAMEWRSPRIAAQVDTFGDLGPPARRLEAVYAELAAGCPG